MSQSQLLHPVCHSLLFKAAIKYKSSNRQKQLEIGVLCKYYSLRLVNMGAGYSKLPCLHVLRSANEKGKHVDGELKL